MSTQYPYIISSLPLLQFGQEPPMTADEFVVYCDGLLQPADQEALVLLLEDKLEQITDPEAYDLLRHERQLRNAVTRQRAGRLGVDAGRYVRGHEGWDVEIEEVVAQAMAAIEPLERELMLDGLRWRFLEHAAALPSFGVQAVYSYALRLRMLEKWQRLSDERGTAVAEQIIDSNIAEISV